MRLFGTDGVRGVANRELTPELALALGRAAALELGGNEQARVLIARDTRLSGEMLEAALSAGLMSAGADVVSAGVLPTAGVAYLAERHGFSAGVMISASHNPVPDNGIKFFARDGHKLPDSVEDRIERRMREDTALPVGEGIGRRSDDPALREEYIAHLASLVQHPYPFGVVLDGAHGAATAVLPLAFSPAARTVAVIAGEGDGARINVACGSTAPEYLAQHVQAFGGAIGLAFDGDADRVIAVDEDGEVVDGDVILALLATWLKGRGELVPALVALTVMSNGGVRDFLAARGIQTVETKVGDRYVIEAMRQGNILLGGEQSGHVIYRRAATTGDGLATGILLLSALADLGVQLREFRRAVPRYPQRLRSVRVADRDEALNAPRYTAALEEAERALEGIGRVLVRPSGTEPVVRVMVESRRADVADAWLERLCAALGGN